MPKRINIAVIGVGYLGSYHTEKYAKNPAVHLVAVVDIDPQRARKAAERFGVAFHTDYRKILNQVDAVTISVPTDFHYEIAKTCLESGVDVLVEKPMTEKVWQAERLLDLAKEKGRILQVGHLERFNPAITRAARFLEKPLFIECHRLNSFAGRGTEINVVFDLMIHDLDIILSFVKSKVARMDAVGVPVLSSHMDIANVRLHFETGCVANITASRISLHPMRKMRVFQPDAYVSLDFHKAHVEIYRRIINPSGGLPELKGESLALEKKDALEEEIRSFVKAVSERSCPVVSAESALEALRLADQIVRQIKKTTRRLDSSMTQEISL